MVIYKELNWETLMKTLKDSVKDITVITIILAFSGVFGYGLPTKAFYEAIVSWYRKRYGVEFSRTSIIPTTGVVPAISSILQGLCLPGDEVIIQTPAYNCFFSSVRNSGLVLSENALKLVNGRWEIDFEDLEERASREKARALLFCNPQNPTGRVWTRDELTRVAEICEKHGILLISDEIHGERRSPLSPRGRRTM